MIHFARTTVDRLGAGAPSVYLPYDPAPDAATLPGGEYTPIAVEGLGEYRALTRIARMALLFNEEPALRRQLLHDCGVFALACALDDPLTDRQFDRGELFTFPERRIEDLATADLSTFACNPGDIIKTYKAPYDDVLGVPEPMLRKRSMHLQVRATHPDDMPPLFFSKFGPEGPVLLHTIHAGLAAYPPDTITEVGRPLVNGVQM
jgi:hypothetical protein